jgi:Protein of unknown function (DUF3048) N-terminal domain/Protein of unknown function (DUF3048) C-terminal domain
VPVKITVNRRFVTSLTGGGALLVATAVLLSGCTSPSTTPSASSSGAATAAPTATPTASATPAAVYPLTGLPVPAGVTVGPSLESKIDNLIDARPQIGLQHADIVYEELVEGGLTRYVAVFNSDIPTTYGPVRSIRGMDPAIASPLGGVITYSGGQPIFVTGIKNTKIVNVSDDVYGGDTSLFHRISTKAAPHNLVASGKKIIAKFGKGVAAPQAQFQYATDAASSSAGTEGEDTTKLTTTFSTAESRAWTWDATKNVFTRSQNGKADVDNAGDPISAVNVVSIRVKLKTISHTPVSQLIGTNKATVSTGGKTVEGTYTKASLTDPIHLKDSSGNPITLAPGNTWVEIVATGGSVSHK